MPATSGQAPGEQARRLQSAKQNPGRASSLSRSAAPPAITAAGLHQHPNRYTVPHLYASQQLTLKLYPDQVLLFHHEKRSATPVRSHDRRQQIRNPDHIKELETQRRRSRDQTMLLAFPGLSPQAETYARKLEEKRRNSPQHIRQIVALSEIYGPDKVERALQDAPSFEAFGCEYIANLLEQWARPATPPGARRRTRRPDLLDLEPPPADLPPDEPQS